MMKMDEDGNLDPNVKVRVAFDFSVIIHSILYKKYKGMSINATFRHLQ